MPVPVVPSCVQVREGGCLAIEDLVGDDPADGSSSSSNSAVPQHVLSSEGLLVASPYHLELVSQREVFAAPRRVALNRPVVRIGMQVCSASRAAAPPAPLSLTR